jgi:tetratricopeptide (TPR) repeat protein
VTDGDDVTRRDPSDEDGDATDITRREGVGQRRSGARSDDRASDEVEHLGKGTKIGRYVVIDILGAGGMGVVYSAFDPELDRRVAIKILQAQHGGSESGGQSWLLREAQAMARLAHPNVVAVYDVGVMSADHVFVAMELVDGETMRSWAKTPRPWREIVAVMRQAATGLAAAHAAGLVHRDFKPDNVLVGSDGRARVMDFGLARLQGASAEERAARTSDLQIEAKSPLSERLTQTGALLGTPAYMAPEIYAGQGADAYTDQFAFGVAMYEALYRVRPFERNALVEKRAIAPTVPPASKIPTWLRDIVLRAIAIDPAQRFRSMDDIIDALSRDPARGKKLAAIGAVLAIACGGAVAAGFALRGDTPPDQRCTDAPAKLARVWNPERRAAMETAFRAIGKPFVDDAIEGTELAIDRYANAWVQMQTEACKATRVVGDQSEAVLTARMLCLDERLVELRTLVDLFAKADEPLVLAAASSVQKLSPLADCADTAALLAPDPLPKDPVARQKVIDLQAALAEARTTYRASRPKDALAITQSIAADVERIEYQPTKAIWHFLTGQALWVLEGAAKGEPELMKAVYAAEAGKADEIKVEAWLQLTNLANESSRFDVAAERLQQASAALARLGTKWDLKVRVAASEALLYSRQSQYDKAIEAAKRGREMAEKHTEQPSQIYAALVEATILNGAARPAEALASFQKVLAYHESFGHRRIEVAATLASMATAEMQLGKLDDAVQHLRAAVSINESIYGRESLDVARSMTGLATALSAKGEIETALATNKEALDILARVVGEQSEQYAQALSHYADNLVKVGKHAEALPYLDRALAIQTAKLGEAHVQTLTIALTKCDALSAAKQHDDAIATCLAALANGEKAFGAKNPLLFLFLAHTGLAYNEATKYPDAIAMFERAIALGATDPSDIAFLQMLVARARWATGDKRRAIELARTAHDAFAKLGPDKAAQAKDAADWLAEHDAPQKKKRR